MSSHWRGSAAEGDRRGRSENSSPGAWNSGNFEIGRTETSNPKSEISSWTVEVARACRSNLRFRISDLRFPFVQFQNSPNPKLLVQSRELAPIVWRGSFLPLWL